MSALTEIYLAIANLSLGGVKSRNLPQVTLEVAEADLPLRILVPSTKSEASFIAIGDLSKIEWAIRDLCLWAPLGAGSIEQYAEPMMDYIKAYITAIKAMRQPTGQSCITGWVFQLGPIAWGEGKYWAVDVTLSVEEYL